MSFIFLFFLILVTAFLGALPPGTVNLAVLYTSANNNKTVSKQMSHFAGIAEIIIAVTAILFGMKIISFIEQNDFLKQTLSIVLLVFGVFLLVSKNRKTKLKPYQLKSYSGFILGLINPSVWVYWVIAISVINTHLNTINLSLSNVITLIVFISAVYFGKIIALTLFRNFGHKIQQSKHQQNLKPIIGGIFVLFSIVQLVN